MDNEVTTYSPYESPNVYRVSSMLSYGLTIRCHLMDGEMHGRLRHYINGVERICIDVSLGLIRRVDNEYSRHDVLAIHGM